MTVVNVGLNKVLKGPPKNSIVHLNVQLQVEAAWESPEIHDQVRERIADWYPEWAITGYARVEPEVPA